MGNSSVDRWGKKTAPVGEKKRCQRNQQRSLQEDDGTDGRGRREKKNDAELCRGNSDRRSESEEDVSVLSRGRKRNVSG